MRNPLVKVGVFLFLLLLATGASPPADAQVQPFRKGDEQFFWGLKKKRADKLDFLYKASEVYLFTGTSLDMTSTVQGLNHPEVAHRTDGTVLGRYPSIETGWAGRFGRENTVAVVAANVALNAGITLLSRKLYRLGGRWRIPAITLNVLKGTDNMVAGIHNMGHTSVLDERIRGATGYGGPIVWSH